MEPHGLTPVAPSAHLVGRNPPKRILLRQGYGGYHPRIHPRVYTRGFLRRRVKSIETSSSNLVAIFPETYLPRGSKPSGLPPSRKSTPASWCRGGLPRRPCLSSGNEPFARGQLDCTLKAPPYHAPGYLLLRSGLDGTSTFRCPRPSVSLPSEQYLWAMGSAPKQGDIRSKCSQRERRLG